MVKIRVAIITVAFIAIGALFLLSGNTQTSRASYSGVAPIAFEERQVVGQGEVGGVITVPPRGVDGNGASPQGNQAKAVVSPVQNDGSSPLPVDGRRPSSSVDMGEKPEPRVISGSSLLPVGGKPVGPFDISWNLEIIGNTVNGSVEVINHSQDATVLLTATAIGTARVTSGASQECAIGREKGHRYPISIALGSGVNAISLTATRTLFDKRSRTVVVALDEAPPAINKDESKLKADPGGIPIRGTTTITDASGQRVEFHPSSK